MINVYAAIKRSFNLRYLHTPENGYSAEGNQGHSNLANPSKRHVNLPIKHRENNAVWIFSEAPQFNPGRQTTGIPAEKGTATVAGLFLLELLVRRRFFRGRLLLVGLHEKNPIPFGGCRELAGACRDDGNCGTLFAIPGINPTNVR
jgi:hypothetical protein